MQIAAMKKEPDNRTSNVDAELAQLRLMHLADSALPIGALAHSFGLESLAAGEMLHPGNLFEFLEGFLHEAGKLEGVACREAYRLFVLEETESALRRWIELNDDLSALKPARESREGSAALGRNFLNAVIALEDFRFLVEARGASRESGSAIHHCAAFGLASAVLGIEEESAVQAYLHQMVMSLVSACQRLMPLGQTAATRILWNLKPAMLEVARESAGCSLENVNCFTPILDWGATEHPALTTRLFIS
jgi:urease accessory protein